MFKVKLRLSELARMLRRSEQSLVRDIEAGIFSVRDLQSGRRTGTNFDYEVTVSDLERYLGEDKARSLTGAGVRKGKEKVTLVDRVPHEVKPRVEGMYKKCRTCGSLRLIKHFARDPKSPDWLAADCMYCAAKKRR